MPILRFEGYSDDTFGEVEHTKDDYDNCASGKPIEYLVAHRESGMGVVVTGQHCPGNSGSWFVVNFVVFADGVAAGTFSTQASAWAYQDTLWAAAQNKTMEALYAGR